MDCGGLGFNVWVLETAVRRWEKLNEAIGILPSDQRNTATYKTVNYQSSPREHYV